MQLKSLLTILFFSFACSNSFSQNNNIIIADQTDRSPLPYATIKALKANRGYYADKNGMAGIPVFEKDSLMVEYAGHTATVFIIKENTDTVFLNRKELSLETVEIKQANTIREVGFFKYRKMMTLFFAASTEYALKIDLSSTKGKYYRVQQLYMPLDINRKTFDDCIVKFHLYNEAADGTPGEDILTSPVFLTKDSLMKKDFYIDISGQHIIAADKYLFVGIECIMDKITALYNPNLSERRSFNQQANLSPVSLYFSKQKELFDGGYGHTFIRMLNSSDYHWTGNTYSTEPFNFSAGLVLMSSE